jgi:Na+/proline symporter
LVLREVKVRRPSLKSVLVGLIPFVAVCFSVSLWDRIEPTVAGLPFNLFWLIAWVLVNLLLLGYSGVTQFFPGVVFGLYWRRAPCRAFSSA